jgi:hypothetical protein
MVIAEWVVFEFLDGELTLTELSRPLKVGPRFILLWAQPVLG